MNNHVVLEPSELNVHRLKDFLFPPLWRHWLRVIFVPAWGRTFLRCRRRMRLENGSLSQSLEQFWFLHTTDVALVTAEHVFAAECRR